MHYFGDKNVILKIKLVLQRDSIDKNGTQLFNT
jgi:hypothetical protein